MERARRRLIDFCTFTFVEYRPGRVHRFIAQQLEAVERGEIKRLMLFCPPRTGKTELLMRFIAWYLGRNPDREVLYASYGADLAWEKSAEIRRIVASDEYALLWPGVRLDPQSRSVQRWRIAGRRGVVQAAGVGGSFTGKGGHLIVADDLVKNRAEADSLRYREATWSFFTSTMRTRLEPGGAIVLVMTRWHEDDVAGRLLRLADDQAEADQWTVVKLPALAKPFDSAQGADPLGRAPGEALDPGRYDEGALKQIRATIGSRDWAALFDQEPRVDEGNVFKRPWLKRVPVQPRLVRAVVAWDTAYESKEQNDFSAAVLVGQGEDGRYYVLPLVHERLEFPELVRAAKGVMQRFPEATHIIEGKATGKSVRQQLRAEGIPLIEVEPAGDKVARAYAVTRFFEADLVSLVEGRGVDALEHELLAFPTGAHDDQVDALVYALSRVAGRGSGIWI